MSQKKKGLGIGPGGHLDVKLYTCMNITSKTDP